MFIFFYGQISSDFADEEHIEGNEEKFDGDVDVDIDSEEIEFEESDYDENWY